MNPDEMIEDLNTPEVREALADLMRYDLDRACDSFLMNTIKDVRSAIRAKPATVKMPAAEIPAPLTDVPESGEVWSICPYSAEKAKGVVRLGGALARRAIAIGMAWDTKDKAVAALDAFTAREPASRPGDDWTPHTPGDLMPCDRTCDVEIRLRNGRVNRGEAGDFHWGFLGDHSDIIEWRYAREDEA